MDERADDLSLMSVALMRSVTSRGELVELGDLATELGVDPDDED